MSENKKSRGRQILQDNPTLRRQHLREQWRTAGKKINQKKKDLGLKYYECITDVVSPAKSGPKQKVYPDETVEEV